MSNPIHRVFIANRGEIARRIAIAAKHLGIESVALYNAPTPPVFLQDCVTELVLCPEESTSLYLDAKRMIGFAKASGADAIHPGFGFLSENAGFARDVIAAGLTWIGPGPEAIDAMASKASARELAAIAHVPILPGLQHIDLERNKSDLKRVYDFALNTGYPLLIKAAFGGGGKGMRLVHTAEDLEENASRASSEALRAFGDGSIIIEKYLPLPRHVEVQILADSHGKVLSIGDRDCSLQRRHQKILEEAPAPDINPKVRESMHRAARNLAEKVNYVSAGTVEFLVIGTDEQQQFFFLEMNTRLQVEHPVTEQVFGIDLVEWQFKIAAGEALTLRQEDVIPRAHSIEARLYAEDMAQQFLPTPGAVHAFIPYQGQGIRWELGLDPIDRITTAFDPMVSKLVVTATNRTRAMNLLAETLERTIYCGPTSNIPYIASLARQKDFQTHVQHTHFIQDNLQNIISAVNTDRNKMSAYATAIKDEWLSGSSRPQGNKELDSIKTLTEQAFHPSKQPNSLTGLTFLSQSTYVATSRVYTATTTQKISFWDGSKAVPGAIVLTEYAGTSWIYVQLAANTWKWPIGEALTSREKSANKDTDSIVSQVPGKVIALKAKAGETIKKDQVIAILESMKMQFEVQAPRDGILAQWLIKEGDQVEAEAVLIKWGSAT